MYKRNAFAADLVRKEVLAKHRRALLLYADGHLFRIGEKTVPDWMVVKRTPEEPLVSQLEKTHPGTVFNIPGLVVAFVLLGCVAAACGAETPPSAIQVQRNLITVDNRTPHDWLDVEIWINRQYRLTVPRIAAASRFSTTLDVFVAGFGQRFDIRRQRIDDLRLTAHQPDGTPVRIEAFKGGTPKM
jgi:hypothetical protein